MTDPSFAYFLIAIALALMAAELLLPTGGVLFALGGAALLVGIVMLFTYDATQALVTLVALVLVTTLAGPLLLRLWTHAVGRRLALPGADDDATVAAMPVNLELEALRGRYGRTRSPLRPAGVTEFDGRRIDTLSEGPFVEAGCWVRCVDVRAGKIIVRPSDAPPNLLSLDDPITV